MTKKFSPSAQRPREGLRKPRLALYATLDSSTYSRASASSIYTPIYTDSIFLCRERAREANIYFTPRSFTNFKRSPRSVPSFLPAARGTLSRARPKEKLLVGSAIFRGLPPPPRTKAARRWMRKKRRILNEKEQLRNFLKFSSPGGSVVVVGGGSDLKSGKIEIEEGSGYYREKAKLVRGP